MGSQLRLANTTSTIHKSVDLFTSPRQLTDFEDHNIVRYDPTTKGSSSAKFLLGSGNGSEYMAMHLARLYVAVRIVANDGSDVDDSAEKVLPINGIFSLFSQVDVEMNSTLISDQTRHHPYSNMFDTLFNYNGNGQSGKLECMGFYKDTAHQHNSLASLDGYALNKGHQQRWNSTKGSRLWELEGPIGVDVLTSRRLVLNSVKIKLDFHYSSPEFYLMADTEGKKYKFVIHDMCLHVPHVKLSSAVMLSHEAQLASESALYPFMHKQFTGHTIEQNSLTSRAYNLFQGMLPNMIVVALVDDRAYNGDLKFNPYEFGHFGVREIDVRVGSKLLNAVRVQLDLVDAADMKYVEAYGYLLSALRKWTGNDGSMVGRSDFIGGYTLFVYDLENGFADEENYPAFTTGSVHIDFKFSSKRDHEIQAVICGYYRTINVIDGSRRVVFPLPEPVL